MARLGVRTVAELIGRNDLLVPDEAVDALEGARHRPAPAARGARRRARDAPRHCVRRPEPVLYDSIDLDLLQRARPAIEGGEHVRLERRIENKNRAVGGLLSGEIARRHGEEGLPEGTIEVHLQGSAGQSFGAWLAAGVTLELEGDANDYTRQGHVRRHARGAPARGGHLPRRGQRDRRQHGSLRGHLGQGLLPRPRRRALRGAQLGRPLRGRGRGRPRLRVHDRRPRRGARPDRPQLRRRHERRGRLRARRGRRLPLALQHGAGRASTRSRPDDARSCAASSRSTASAPALRSPSACSTPGTTS